MIENENYNEKKNVRKKLIMTIALVLITIAIGVGGVYAYFAAAVTQDTTSGISISAVSGLKISFSNDANININNALPGQNWKKSFSATLTNKGLAFTTEYSIYLKVTTNGFNDSTGKLTYTLKKNGSIAKENQIITGEDTFEILSTSITGIKDEESVTDSYELTITYPNNETSVQQQGGIFNGSVYFGLPTNGNKIDSNSVETAKEITFLINGTEYHALEGMTWEEFETSAYNVEVSQGDKVFSSKGTDWSGNFVPAGFYIGSPNIYLNASWNCEGYGSNGGGSGSKSSALVSLSDVIREGCFYGYEINFGCLPY